MPVVSVFYGAYAWLKRELNFFRVHLLFFLLVPLVSAAIFWGVNGRFHISFIDALFLCYSALTVTGLSTVNLSTCTVLQQAILFFLMCIGNVTVVAWVMVLIRKRYFRIHLQNLKRQEHSKRKIGNRILQFAYLRGQGSKQADPEILVDGPSRTATTDGLSNGKIFVSEGIGAALVGAGSAGIGLGIGMGGYHAQESEKSEDVDRGRLHLNIEPPNPAGRLPSILRLSSSSDRAEIESPVASVHSFEIVNGEPRGVIADAQSFTSSLRSGAVPLPLSPLSLRSGTTRRTQLPFSPMSGQSVRRRPGVPVPRRRQTVFQPPQIFDNDFPDQIGQRGKDQGYGGFPGPIQLSQRFVQRFLPQAYERFKRLVLEPASNKEDSKRFKRWTDQFSGLVIGRNSDFHTEELTDEELEELGGLEYRALRLLSYLVAIYFVGTQLIAFTLIAPWLSTTHGYDDVFTAQPRLVNKSWFVAFQIVGSYTGGGMSLVDEGMVPFQQAYLMIFAMIFAILAGNHGLPIFLRLSIWILTKFVRDGSTADKTLHFLLDHPRRCFLYLFPSHVTWFLLATLVTFTGIEWASFIVLDLGLDVIESLPPGTQAVAGLFQSFAVRASGFAIVSLSSLAPSFQFLCIVMMYIAVYPVALSIRSTNVYEEKSLGVFAAEPEDEDEEPELGEAHGTRGERIGRYFGWHLRRQVAYDIWWLVCGIFLVCVIERTKIMDEQNAPWFNLFRIVFELVSAFGGIGLTLGIPTENYSFSGSFGPLSKLVVIVIMLRGRHRGLPVAIDRAILLPADVVPASNAAHDLRSPTQFTPTSNVNMIDMVEKGRTSVSSPKLET